jgi:hypothetical protein
MQYAEKGVEVHFCNVAPTPWTTSIGICYALGALACTVLASLSWPWGALLVWPAMTLGLVASGYFGLGARVYGKRNGYLPWRWRWLVAPDQWGQEISRRYYRRKRSAAWNAITPRVWMGAWPDDTTSRELLAAGVSAVLDLTAVPQRRRGRRMAPPERARRKRRRGDPTARGGATWAARAQAGAAGPGGAGAI